MIKRIKTRLSVAFGILFTIIFLFTGLIVYFQVNTILAQVVNSNLDSISDLIKRIVMANIENREGEIKKDLIVAEYFLRGSLALDYGKKIIVHSKNILNEDMNYRSYPALKLNGSIVSGRNNLIERIVGKTHGIAGIYQFTPDGLVLVSTNKVYDDGTNAVGETIPPEASIYTLIMRDKTYFGRDYFNHKWFFTGYKLLYSKSRIIGVLFVALEQIEFDKLKKDILSIKIGEEGSPYIIDQMSRVVVHQEKSRYMYMPYKDMLSIIFKRNGRIAYTQMDPDTGRKGKYVAFFKYIPDINWIVIVGSSVSDFYGPLSTIRIVFLIFFGFGVILSIIMSNILGYKITEPIIMIKDKVKEISEGDANLTKYLDVKSEDEIGLLAEYFNNFMGKLRNVKEVDQHSIEIILRDAHVSALQAQINPHFLYNTLETIRFMISLKDERSVTMIQLLADLFRISISKDKKYVTFKEEIEHVRLYLSIQKIRYSDRFSVILDFPDGFEELYTIKFILQPIVENSVHHGFKELENNGVIKITAQVKSNSILVCIEDNGCGIRDEKISSLNDSLKKREQTGSIGLQNVHSRIQLHFGMHYGIRLESMFGKGTKVMINLPLINEEPPSDTLSEFETNLLLF